VLRRKEALAMQSKFPEKSPESALPCEKKPYEAPVLKPWGSLKDITLAGGSRKNDNAKNFNSRTN
jgi:hypothetical protein